MLIMTVTISDALVKELQEKANGKTVEELVQEAITLWIQIQNQQDIKSFRGKLMWEGDLNTMREEK